MIENCPKRPFLTILESFGELVLKPVNITTIRKSNSLKSKYQEMRGVFRLLHSAVMCNLNCTVIKFNLQNWFFFVLVIPD